LTAALKPYAGKEFVTYHDFALLRAEIQPAKFLVDVPEGPIPGGCEDERGQGFQLKTLLTEPQAAGNPFEALAKTSTYR